MHVAHLRHEVVLPLHDAIHYIVQSELPAGALCAGAGAVDTAGAEKPRRFATEDEGES